MLFSLLNTTVSSQMVKDMQLYTNWAPLPATHSTVPNSIGDSAHLGLIPNFVVLSLFSLGYTQLFNGAR